MYPSNEVTQTISHDFPIIFRLASTSPTYQFTIRIKQARPIAAIVRETRAPACDSGLVITDQLFAAQETSQKSMTNSN